MAVTNFTLSKKEKELMDIFWESGVPLARAEILEHAEQRKCSWKPNSVHILVNSLLDKNAVKVAGLYLNSRKLGRTFEPAITREEYALMQIRIAADQAKTEGVTDAKCIVSALVDSTADIAAIDEAVKILKAKKKALGAE